MVAGLLEHGYLQRSADPGDARAALLSATPAGRQLVSGLRSHRVDELAVRLRRLSDADRTALLAAGPALARLVASDA